MNYIFFDDHSRDYFLPLTFTRPVSEIRIGILTIKEKWERCLGSKCFDLAKDYLSVKFPVSKADVNTLINSTILPDTPVIDAIATLRDNEVLVQGDSVIAVRIDKKQVENFDSHNIKPYTKKRFVASLLKLNATWDIFKLNRDALLSDFELLTKGKASALLSSTNNCLGENIFIEEGAKAEFATFNTTEGPVYIGKDAEVMEGSMIRGGLALCNHSVLKMGAKIYGPTTIGPYCKVGGEVNNSVFFGYSNKAHDGFLGNSVIGEWCNIGADSNNSNLKNNYEDVKLWSYTSEKFEKTGLQFCGLIMGDHSKCGINTMFNTGTVVGVSANIFGSGFPRNFIPSFAWGGAQGFTTYVLDKAFESMKKVLMRRGLELTVEDRNILSHVFEVTRAYRRF